MKHHYQSIKATPANNIDFSIHNFFVLRVCTCVTRSAAMLLICNLLVTAREVDHIERIDNGKSIALYYNNVVFCVNR